MTAVAKKIEQEIRQLPLEDMIELQEQLLVSIYEKEGAQPFDPAFRSLVEGRIKDINSGKAEGVDAFGALNDM